MGNIVNGLSFELHKTQIIMGCAPIKWGAKSVFFMLIVMQESFLAIFPSFTRAKNVRNLLMD